MSRWPVEDWLAELWPSGPWLAALRRAGGRWPAAPFIDAPADADLAVIAELHAGAFARGWSEAEIAALLVDPGVAAVVARRSSPYGTRRPVGFAITRTAADEAEILTVAVHPRWRGRGVGRGLLEALLRRLYADRVAAVFLEVAADNAAAVTLYRRLGFVVVGERRGYYADGGAGGLALVMRLNLS